MSNTTKTMVGGKYAGITPGMPRFKPEETYQSKVAIRKNDVVEGLPRDTSAALVHAYVQARDEVSDTKKKLYEANLRLEAVTQLLTDRFEDEDITSIKVSGATVRVQIEPYAVIRDKGLFRQWCIDNGLGESLALPWSTANMVTKDRVLAGEPEPSGVEIYQKHKVVMVKERK